MSDQPKDAPPAKPKTWLLALYYLAILLAIIFMHGRGGLETPKFIYQGF
jgi:hypothetical protein